MQLFLNSLSFHSCLTKSHLLILIHIRSLIYMSSSAAAEAIASFLLCPWEAIRIRMVSQPEMFKNLNAISGTKMVYKQEGIAG